MPFVRKSGLTDKAVILLFLVKIFAGLAIGFIAYQLTPTGNDYWGMNTEGIKEHQLLLNDPYKFFTSIFYSNYARGYSGFFDALPSYWNDLRATIISKFLAPFNFLTGGNYYLNSLFFNFFCFLGHAAFYRLFMQLYPNKKIAVIVSCFLLPSMLYFSSGIQKDGIVFTAMGFLLYTIFQSLQYQKFTLKSIGIIFLMITVLFFIRSYVPILLMPALILWIIADKLKFKPLSVFVIGYITVGFLFFSLNFITKTFNPLEVVIKKQEAFFMLPTASTQVALDTLHPNFKSFVQVAPQAIVNSFFRPHFGDIINMKVGTLLPLILELLFYELILLFFLFYRIKNENKKQHSFIYAGLFFSATMFLFIGSIVPNLGSIVRYRSIYLIFIIAPLVCGIDWKKVHQLIKIKK